mmetsp:Transcript_37150/g.61095  ORF Transcript_37150/g.61095 Transcript_37150/m.61095 type:complete len:252 (-) Transcript_37150:73-828(-)
MISIMQKLSVGLDRCGTIRIRLCICTTISIVRCHNIIGIVLFVDGSGDRGRLNQTKWCFERRSWWWCKYRVLIDFQWQLIELFRVDEFLQRRRILQMLLRLLSLRLVVAVARTRSRSGLQMLIIFLLMVPRVFMDRSWRWCRRKSRTIVVVVLIIVNIHRTVHLLQLLSLFVFRSKPDLFRFKRRMMMMMLMVMAITSITDGRWWRCRCHIDRRRMFTRHQIMKLFVRCHGGYRLRIIRVRRPLQVFIVAA